jgi:hypothetical protein
MPKTVSDSPSLAITCSEPVTSCSLPTMIATSGPTSRAADRQRPSPSASSSISATSPLARISPCCSQSSLVTHLFPGHHAYRAQPAPDHARAKRDLKPVSCGSANQAGARFFGHKAESCLPAGPPSTNKTAWRPKQEGDFPVSSLLRIQLDAITLRRGPEVLLETPA